MEAANGKAVELDEGGKIVIDYRPGLVRVYDVEVVAGLGYHVVPVTIIDPVIGI
jgi:hypothetical protein